uniref:KIND domain-containing protein n=1 Tax=Monopterus albus TaxID=43700 RepID=A0A3Q3JLI8_MONAL
MAKRPGTDDGICTSPTILRDFTADLNAVNMTTDCGDGADEVSLEEILSLYGQPINEEQAWAVCYQCCRTLAQKHRRKSSRSRGASALYYPKKIEGPRDVRVGRDGTIKLHFEVSTDKDRSAPTSLEIIDSLGVMIYKALDYGLKENEERELSPPLERLIDLMTNNEETESDPCPDEGYEATEEDEDEEQEPEPISNMTIGTVSSIHSYRDIIMLCSSHLPSPSDAPNHYQAVCRALYAETRELHTFLEKIKNAKEHLQKIEGETRVEPVKDLNELQNADWVNGNIPPRLKKSAHEIILEFIRSRPPLNPGSARKLKPHPPRPQSLHERLLEGIRSERKLRPVSPEVVRRKRLGAGKSISTPQDLFVGADSPDAPRKLAVSTQSLASDATESSQGGVQPLNQKKLLKAPALDELDSSESDEEPTRSSSSVSTSLMEDTSPEPVIGKKDPPKFLPVSTTLKSEKSWPSLRRHSIEKESPASVCPVLPSRQSTKSLEEFCYPVQCLALTVEEVMHIRQVLVKAELEKFQQYKDVYNALKKGKLCFSCRIKRFSLFTWSYTCQFCKRPVCSQCSRKMRVPSKPYSTLPIYSLGLSAMAKEESSVAAEAEKDPFGSGHSRHSLRRSVSKLSSHRSTSIKDGSSQDELELPKELTEDWVTMEVCLDCKKFITEIIFSSRRSLSVASKCARLNRKTKSFYMSSPKSINFSPSERTINEV